MKITKKAVEDLLLEYIEDKDRPLENQPDNRFPDCFDESIVDEFIARVGKNEFNTIEDMRRRFRNSLRKAEEHANMYKRARVIDKDIAYAFQEASQ